MSRTSAVSIALLILVGGMGSAFFLDSTLGRFMLIAVMPGPDHPFTTSHAQDAPDYSLASNWLAHSEIVDNTDWKSEGEQAPLKADDSAYVFFIHPTAFLGNNHWIGSLDKDSATEENRQWTIANQASAFNRCCEVFAPYYREVSISTYFQSDLDIIAPVIDFAYRDVERAFESFLQNIPENAPFIIASHSQGTLHGQRLLQQIIDGNPLSQRLVAAYLVGGTVQERLFSSQYKDIGICRTATDVHCAIAFDTWRLGVQTENSVPNWFGDRYVRTDDRWLCVNPLSWEYNEEAVSAGQNPGSRPAQNEYNLYSFGGDVPVGLTWEAPESSVQGLASAQCVDGVLRAEDVEPGPFDGQSWGGNYHSLEYALYYDSIRDNAQQRVTAWWSEQRLTEQQ
jgi:hypothetical protein